MMRRGIRNAQLVPLPSMLASLAVAVLMVPAAATAADEAKGQAAGLLERAAGLSRIRTAETSPFKVTATLKVSPTPSGGGEMQEGSYLLVWSSPAAWREEYRYTGFEETRVGGEATVHVSRSPAWRSLQIQRLAEALDQQSLLRIGRKESVGSLEAASEGGRGETCVTLVGGEDGGRRICLDEASGTLMSVRVGALTTEYADYRSWNGRSFPGSIRILRETEPLVELTVGGIAAAAAADTDSGVFTPPEGAEERRWCEEANAPIPRRRTPPAYGDDMMEKGITGHVIVYGTLGRDVKVRNVEVLESSHPYLTWAVTQAIKRWWIRPATCGTKPIRTDLVVEFEFPPPSVEK